MHENSDAYRLRQQIARPLPPLPFCPAARIAVAAAESGRLIASRGYGLYERLASAVPAEANLFLRERSKRPDQPSEPCSTVSTSKAVPRTHGSSSPCPAGSIHRRRLRY